MKLNWEQDPLHPSCHEVQNHCNRRYEEIDRPVQDNEMEEVTSCRIVTLGTWATTTTYHCHFGISDYELSGGWGSAYKDENLELLSWGLDRLR